MALEPGKQIGPYKITGHLGTGGMGEVYRATDQNLGRDVAIKVLPDALADDPERLARFEREAQLLASLNHPNIGGIYGLEQSDGNRCLILELIEGPTLAEMIDAGPLPLEKAFPLALQIAQALEAAHDKGIIHRDLKPANIKVTPEGAVKVLDFGLAKAFTDEAADGSAATMNSPTLTMAATQVGVILGTAAYMSPEQAAGQPADRRADIWSFGVVFQEMLTGHRAFEGETVSHMLAAVLKDEPDWNELPDDLPPRMLELLQSCLQKKTRQRLQAIGDARIVLEAWLQDPASFTTPAATAGTTLPAEPQKRRAPWLVAATLALALVATLVTLWPEAPRPTAPIRLSVALAAGQELFRGYGTSVLLSPDGSSLAYITSTPGQERGIFVRALDQWEGIELAKDLVPYHPFFSPDGEWWIGFVNRQAMFKVPVRGGSPIKIADVSFNRGASWGEDGFIVYTPSPASGLLRIPEAGGEPESLTEIEEQGSHRWPQILPGGKAVLFTSVGGEYENFDEAQIEVLILETKERRVLHRGGTYARYVGSGHIVFVSGTSMFAAPFDLDSLTMTGSIVPVLEGLSTDPVHGGAQFSVSDNGRLAYVEGGGSDTGSQLVWVDRSGNRSAISDERRTFLNPELSPDQTQLAVEIRAEGKSDIWVYDLERSLPTRITSGVGNHSKPIWSHDGRWILCGVDNSGRSWIERIAADGSGEPEILLESEVNVAPTSLSPDGQRLLYRHVPSGNPDLAILQIESGETETFLDTDAIDYDARFSPDGRWIAYGNNQSGDFEVYVVPADGGRGRWQISDKGAYPRWSADGRALFYRDSGDGRIFEVLLEAGTGTIRAGRPRVVVEGGPFLWINGPDNDFAVAADGKSFVMLEINEGDQEVHEHVKVVLGWADALRGIAGGK